jgi:hypothetical protein
VVALGIFQRFLGARQSQLGLAALFGGSHFQAIQGFLSIFHSLKGLRLLESAQQIVQRLGIDQLLPACDHLCREPVPGPEQPAPGLPGRDRPAGG